MTPTKQDNELDEILVNLANQIAANEQRLLNGNATREETIDSDSNATMRAEKAIKDYITANYTPNSEVAEREQVARLNEAFLIAVKYEKGEYRPAEYMIERKNELEAHKKPQR